MIPAAGQGILAVQGRAGKDYGYLAGFHDEQSRVCALAERAFVRAMGGDCSTPVGAYARVEGGTVILNALFVDEETDKRYRGSIEGSVQKPQETGILLAKRLRKE